jgi:hypothetical protein
MRLNRFLSFALGLAVASPALAFSVKVTPQLAAYDDAPALQGGVPATVTVASAGWFDDAGLTVAGTDCAVNGTAGCTKYATGSITLTATSGANTTFVGWAGCNSVAGNVCTVNATADRAVVAQFKPAAYTFRIGTSPRPTATWTPSYGGSLTVGGLEYRSTAALAYSSVLLPAGVAAVVTATPDVGSEVKAWTGCTPATPTATTCTVTPYAPTALTVAFTAPPASIVRAAVAGNGAITGTGMSCRAYTGDCDTLAPVTLTAVSDAGAKFAGWTGCSSNPTPTTCETIASAYVTATFKTSGCGACHGLPPAAPHVADGACADCHAGYTNETVNAALHMNGVKDGGHDPAVSPIFATATTASTGPGVSAQCVRCHPTQANDLLASVHWRWLGSSTMVGSTGANSIGKRNLINNFCVALPSNESRCMQCHPSYSVAPSKDPATGAVAANTGPMYAQPSATLDKSRIDCVICHANLATSKYVKAPAPFGAPSVATGKSCEPSCAANQICSHTDSAGVVWSDGLNHCRPSNATTEVIPALRAAAASSGAPDRANCGFCHFTAGGGDNVKMGDLGSALKNPTVAVDVHMGADKVSKPWAPTLCSDCHTGSNHKIRGSGLSIPVDEEGRFSCTDCHSGLHPPEHVNTTNTAHAEFMGCQTCHIPQFSRTQYTKMDWDWQTALDKQACQGLAGCVGFGSLTYPAGSTVQTGTIAGVGGEAPRSENPLSATTAQYYDWKKGIAIWETNVVPAYKFVAPDGQQQGTHEVIARDTLLGSGTPEDPFRLADPLQPPSPVLAGWKIKPFKEMTGRTPAFADDSAMIVPRLFGMDSLWQTDLRGYPVVPNTLGCTTQTATGPCATAPVGGNPWTQAKADGYWTGANNYGAAVSGQLGQPVAKAAGGQMTRDASHLVTVNTVADLPEPLPATLYLVGAEAAFPTGVKAVTKTGPRQFTYTETIAYTVNTGQPALPALPATSTQFVAFYPELSTAGWKWANTVMYIAINHEVAPHTEALGCASCHPSMGGTVETSRMKDLYNLSATGCTDPMDCSKR